MPDSEMLIVVLDASRIAAQVVSGIGFLGAGAILARGEIVKVLPPLEEAYRSRNQSCQLRVVVDSGSLTPELLREALSLRAGQIKRFLVESRNPQGTDDLVILLSKVSSHDIATFPEKLKELDGVREVTIMKKSKDHAPS